METIVVLSRVELTQPILRGKVLLNGIAVGEGLWLSIGHARDCRSASRHRPMILVKAAPVLTSELQESTCVAAMRLGSQPEWIRLHPVPFRDLADDTKFRKYQEVTVQAIRPHSDRRPESWIPIEGSIQLGETLRTDHGWSTRRQRIGNLGEQTMCDLVERNRSGSGPDTPSLAVVRTVERPELLITVAENCRCSAVAVGFGGGGQLGCFYRFFGPV